MLVPPFLIFKQNQAAHHILILPLPCRVLPALFASFLSYLQTFSPTSQFPSNSSIHQELWSQEQGKGCRRPCCVWSGPDRAVAGGESHMMGLGVVSTTDQETRRHQMATYFSPYFQWLSTTSTGQRSQCSIPRPSEEGKMSQTAPNLAQGKPAGRKCEDSLEGTSEPPPCHFFCLTC